MHDVNAEKRYKSQKMTRNLKSVEFEKLINHLHFENSKLKYILNNKEHMVRTYYELLRNEIE